MNLKLNESDEMKVTLNKLLHNTHWGASLIPQRSCEHNVENKKKSLLPPTLVELRRDMSQDLMFTKDHTEIKGRKQSHSRRGGVLCHCT